MSLSEFSWRGLGFELMAEVFWVRGPLAEFGIWRLVGGFGVALSGDCGLVAVCAVSAFAFGLLGAKPAGGAGVTVPAAFASCTAFAFGAGLAFAFGCAADFAGGNLGVVSGGSAVPPSPTPAASFAAVSPLGETASAGARGVPAAAACTGDDDVLVDSAASL